MRAVIDANVIVSGLLIPEGRPAEVLRRWKAGVFDLITSPPLLTELANVLSRPRIARRLPTPELGLEFLTLLADAALIVEPVRTLDVVTADPSDNRVVEAAVEGRVDFIVSGDDDLLSLGAHHDIPIVSPARFLATLEEPNL